MNICVYGASSRSIGKIFTDAAFELGAACAQRGHALVFGGGNAGVMGACARGARSCGGEIIGVVPKFFNVDGVIFPECTRLIRTDTMRERKALLDSLADGFVVAPGGIGTYDEFFEMLTLKQLERHEKAMAIYNVDGFYDGLLEFLQSAMDKNFMKQATKRLYGVFSKSGDALDYIENYVHVPLALSELKDVDLINHQAEK